MNIDSLNKASRGRKSIFGVLHIGPEEWYIRNRDLFHFLVCTFPRKTFGYGSVVDYDRIKIPLFSYDLSQCYLTDILKLSKKKDDVSNRYVILNSFGTPILTSNVSSYERQREMMSILNCLMNVD